MPKQDVYISLSSGVSLNISAAQAMADEVEAEINSEAAALSDREVYEGFMKLRKESGIPIITFDEFWGNK